MKTLFSNTSNIHLAFLPWLLDDQYQHNDDPMHYSATEFNKSIREAVLSKRVPDNTTTDVASLVASRIGTAIHNALEASWKTPELVDKALEFMGYPKRIREGIVINPEGPIETGQYPVYLERRTSKQLGKWTISGMYDLVLMGTLIDYKSTSAFQVRKLSSRDAYIRQGSIYRWLDPKVITDDVMGIGFVVKDWSQGQVSTPDYPQVATPFVQLPLKSEAEIEQEMLTHLETLERLADAPDNELPYCTAEQMWQDAPVYKYYANPEKLGRSTKNFTSYVDAAAHCSAAGKGVVIEVESPRGYCNSYCKARDICGQNLMYRESLIEVKDVS